VTGTERIGWDQDLLTGSHIDEYDFVVYVDGTKAPVASPSCTSANADDSSYTCTAPLPAMSNGQHTLEITAIHRGPTGDIESPRSASLVVTKDGTGGSATAAALGSSQQPGPPEPAAGVVVARVAGGLTHPVGVAAAPDGRVFVAERAGAIRVVTPAGLEAEPAVQLEDLDANGPGISSMALHPLFARNHQIYVAYVAATGDGPVYRITRYTEIAGRLGQASVLFDGVPARRSSRLRIAFTADNRLLVAIGRSGGSDPYDGTILRLTDDGATPPDSGDGSPIFARGLGLLDALTVDRRTGRAWIVEDDAGAGPAVLGSIAAVPGRTVEAITRTPLPSVESAAAMAVSPAVSLRGGSVELLVATGTSVERFEARPGMPIVSTGPPLMLSATVTGIAVGPGLSVYVCTDPASGSMAGFATGTLTRISASP
jgi:hypothetical protein